MGEIGIHFNASQRSDRGTYKVAYNLLQGLDISGIKYRVNPPRGACEYNGFLQGNGWAYQQKIVEPKIMFGPNIVVLPKEAAWCYSEGSRHVVPCQWVYNQYKQDATCKAKLSVWPVGVDTARFVPGTGHKVRDCLIYYKDVTRQVSQSDITKAIAELSTRSMSYTIMKYGSYTEEEFINACQRHRFMIVIAGTESQFIALLEAYAMGIPAYILDMHYMLWAGVTHYGCGFTSAPYTDDRCGIVARDYSMFGKFLEGLKDYNPREYVEEEMSMPNRARQYYEILTGGAD